MKGESEADYYDTQPLVPRSMNGGVSVLRQSLSFYDTEIEDDAVGWHYCMVLPMLTGRNSAELSKLHPSPMQTAQKVFSSKSWEEVQDKHIFKEGMTNHEFHEAMREELVSTLSGPKCGFQLRTKLSIDEDELFLSIALSAKDALHAIAQRQECRMPVKPHLYPEYLPCPTESFVGGNFDPQADQVPLYLRYEDSLIVQEFVNKDIVRMVRKRTRDFFSLEYLQAEHVVLQMFPIHQSDDVYALNECGWSRLSAVLQYPDSSHAKQVRNYFGEEVAFFFHWLSFYTRSLILPGLLGLAFTLFSGDLGARRKEELQFAFGIFMSLWSSLFTKIYARSANFKILQWGMKNYDEVASVRRSYKKELRGSTSETVRQLFHWALVVAFMIETLGVNVLLAHWNHVAKQNPDKAFTFGLKGRTVAMLNKYMTSLNIKIVDTLWGCISPALTKRENWRTDQDESAARVQKLFMVKFLVYYWPFLYSAFLKIHVTGCHGGQEGCIEELNELLITFFVVQLIFTLLGIVIPVFISVYEVRAEVNATSGMGKVYSFLQVQAKLAPYIGFEDDFMDLIMALGFVMMFSVTLPFMAFLALVCNFLILRLLAFRTANVQQRPVPRGSEGIGAWQDFVQWMSFCGVVGNIALAVFEMPLLRHLSLWQRTLIFFALEHAMVLAKVAVYFWVPDVTATHLAVETQNSIALGEVMHHSKLTTLALLATTKPNVSMCATAM